MTRETYHRLIETALLRQQAVSAAGSADTQWVALAEYLWDRMHRAGHCYGR